MGKATTAAMPRALILSNVNRKPVRDVIENDGRHQTHLAMQRAQPVQSQHVDRVVRHLSDSVVLN